jgi:ABC-type bacteriocin/lantibiotic exporter with double-glycine peptidase domain
VTEHDCAIWAIKAMCFQLHVSVPSAKEVRRQVDLDNVGTSIEGVRHALESFGVSAQPVQGPCDSIAAAPLPAIAMIRLDRSKLHYVVVLKADQRSVQYLDPAMGGAALTASADKFAAVFTGNLVLCERKPNYTNLDVGEEVEPEKFVIGALLHEWNSALALAIGEGFQLVLLLMGILMLKNFFSSSMLGEPNLWFLAGIAVCAAIYIWIGRLQEIIRADVKSRTLLALFSFGTGLIKNSEIDPKRGLRETSARCVKAISAVANSLTNCIRLPGHIVNLILYISFVAWFDFYAAWYAIALSIVLPLIGLAQAKRSRLARKNAAKSRDRNQMGLVYLMAKAEAADEVIADLPWNQIDYGDAVSKHDRCVNSESMSYMAVSRLNVFAGLLIGGLQHETHGMGHTIIVFFLLSVFTSVVCQFSRQLVSIPDCRFQVRAMLDFFSDLTSESLNFGSTCNSKLGFRNNSDQLEEAQPVKLGAE